MIQVVKRLVKAPTFPSASSFLKTSFCAKGSNTRNFNRPSTKKRSDLLAERLKHFEEKPSENPITTARARLRQVKAGINNQKDLLKVQQKSKIKLEIPVLNKSISPHKNA